MSAPPLPSSRRRPPAPALLACALLAALLLLLSPALGPSRPRGDVVRRLEEVTTAGGPPGMRAGPGGGAPPERPSAGPGPPAEAETVRRRLHEHTRDLRRFLRAELRDGVAPERAAAVLERIAQRTRSLLADEERLAEADGHAASRRREATAAARLVGRRLRALQHPRDCRAARKVVCSLGDECGFGCQLHQLVFCLVYAYAERRTLVLRSQGWAYHPGGWEEVFLPLSENCTDLFGEEPVDFSDQPSAKVVSLPVIYLVVNAPAFLPPAVPRDLADRVARFSGDAAAWWVGQLASYLLRPTEGTQRHIDRAVAEMKVKAPYVGVQVRRTDKLRREAKFHALEEYMAHVEDHFATRHVDGPRRVYIASDDPSVLKEARQKYPAYEFLGDPEISQTAAQHAQRRHPAQALVGLLADLHVLASADHLVCTLSSNVGRLAYEMMQSRRVDASARITSLDYVYFFWGQTPLCRVAIAPHVAAADEEISFRENDVIQITENLWNGYGRGKNRRTNETGLIPWYKTEDRLVLYSFPEYKEVPLT